MPLEIKEWYEHQDLIVKTLRGMQWEFKHDLQKMASNLNDQHKKIQLLEYKFRRHPIIFKNEIKKEKELLKEMLVVFNQQLLIARLTSIGKS